MIATGAKGRTMGAALAALALMPLPVAGMTPPLPCEGAREANMGVHDPIFLGEYESHSGVVVETYFNVIVPKGTGYEALPPPVPALQDFHGTRITHCATGRILALRDVNHRDAATAIAATEFLRDRLKKAQTISYSDLRKAVVALYGKPLEMRETAQTCGCDAYFDTLGPAGQTPFASRKDAKY